MAYKTIRNKVLKDATRLITGTYHGQQWTTPDGFMAINFNLYEGYKTKKEHQIIDQNVLLDKIIDNGFKHSLAVEKTLDENTTELASVETDIRVTVNTLYLELFRSVYPDCIPFLATNSPYKPYTSPVQMYDNNKLVGVIMPLKS